MSSSEDQKRPTTPDKPNVQPLYTYTPSTKTWTPIQPTTTPKPLPQNLHLTTWNIDFQAPCKSQCMTSALRYLHITLTNTPDPSIPEIIFLQEMVASDLDIIQQTPWIQDRFFVTDNSALYWRGSYGTTMLLDKRLAVERVFRVPFAESRMGRDGAFH